MPDKFPHLPWHEAASRVAAATFRVYTSDAMGTAFLFSVGKGKEGQHIAMLATAWHVVDQAPTGMTVRICDQSDREVVASKGGNIAVIEVSKQFDVAIIVVISTDDLFPEHTLLPILPSEYELKRGAEVGWLGYPGILNPALCFFQGHVAGMVRVPRVGYLIDGVVIRGVSGGPIFDDRCHIAGLVSAYFYDQLEHESVTLPGVSFMVPIAFITEWVKKNLGARFL